MTTALAKEILLEIGYDVKSLQMELNRILGTNYQYRDVWKWFNTSPPALTAQLFLLMKKEELDRAKTIKKQLMHTGDG